jgi:hypothetical protein
MTSLSVLIATSWIHVFTDGTNPIRIVLLVLYLLALFATVMFFYERRIELKQKKGILQFLAISSVSVLFLLGLAAHQWITARHDIPEHSLAVFLESDEITNTRLTHNHAGKTAIAALVAPFSSYLTPSADTGAGISSFFSPLFSSISALLFVVAIATSLALGPHVIRQVSGRGKRVAAFVLYGLVAFVVLEKTVDGGILNDGAVVAFAAYIALIMLPVRYFFRVLLLGVLVFTMIASILFLSGHYWGGEQYVVGPIANAFVLFLILSALHNACIQGWRSKRTLVVLVIALAALGSKAYADTAFKISYLSAPADPDTSYSATYLPEDNTHTRSIGSIGRLEVQTVESRNSMTIGEVIDASHLPYWYQPVSLYKGSCAEPATRQAVTFVVHIPEAPEELSSVASNLAALTLTPIGTDAAGWSTYTGSLFMHPCVPRRWDVLREMLRTVGVERAIVHGFDLRYLPFDSAGKGMGTSERGDRALLD